MTKSGAQVFLEYIKDIARESEIPYTGFGNISLTVFVQDDEILNTEITNYKVKHKPKD